MNNSEFQHPQPPPAPTSQSISSNTVSPHDITISTANNNNQLPIVDNRLSSPTSSHRSVVDSITSTLSSVVGGGVGGVSTTDVSSTSTVVNNLNAAAVAVGIHHQSDTVDRSQSVHESSFFNSHRLRRKKNLKSSKRNSFASVSHAHNQNRVSPDFPQYMANMANTNENFSAGSLEHDRQNCTKRNVIIHKDSRGYGIRVSGDNPVYIQHVNPDGAAFRAGVRSGDQIIKVNGTLVTRLGHAEVVRMIQSCGSFVGLTLFSNNSSPANSPTPPAVGQQSQPFVSSSISPIPALPTRTITGPQPVTESTQQAYQDNKIKTFQEMIDNQSKHLEELKQQANNPQEIERVSKIVDDLKRKLLYHQSTLANNNNLGALIHMDQEKCSNNGTTSQNIPIRSQIMAMDSDYEDNCGNNSGEMENDSFYYTPCDEDGLNNNSTNNSISPITNKSPPTSKYFPIKLSAKSKRDSKCLSMISTQPNLNVVSMENIHLNSLRIARYVLQNQMMPNALMFYTVTKHIFPSIVNSTFCTTPAAKQIVQRWAYQIVATWVIKEAPLSFLDFPTESLDQFDKNLSNLIAGSLSTNTNIFDPFMDKVKEIVLKQMNDYSNVIQLKPELLSTSPKYDLLTCIEILLLPGLPAGLAGKLDIRELDSTLDQFVTHVKTRISGQTIAMISSLLTIGHYLFNISSKHILLSDFNLNDSGITASSNNASYSVGSSLNPVLKLSDSVSKKSNHKRNTSLPANSRSPISNVNTGSSFDSGVGNSSNKQPLGVMEYGHYYQPIREMTKILYCSVCYGPFWGEYNYICNSCFIKAHLWCRKDSATFQCHNAEASGSVSSVTNSTSNVQLRNKDGSKNRLFKGDKKSMFGKITGKSKNPFQKPDSSGHLNKSSSSISASSRESLTTSASSSDDEDMGINRIVVEEDQQHLISNQAFNECRSSTITVSPFMVQQASDATNSNVNRSGSFNQRKKKKSSSSGTQRKRSDPALTMSTISTDVGDARGFVAGKQLSGAQSSGALISISAASTSGTNSDQFKPLERPRSKNMTASDSSLILASANTNYANSSITSQPNNQNEDNKQSVTKSSINLGSSSPRNSRHKKTSDSGIQMECSSDSEVDATSKETGALDNKLVDNSAKRIPPPLPPRPVSEKRRQIQLEIIDSEQRHFEVLHYIRSVYQRPLRKEKFFSKDQINLIFCNIKDLKHIHRQISKKLKLAHSKDSQSESPDSCALEQTLQEVFCGELGKTLELAASEFCVNQKISNGLRIWNQKRKDSRLNCLLDSEMRSKEMPDCPYARLGLQDLLGTVFQRPLRYPLLLDRLLNATPTDSTAYSLLKQALDSSRDLVQRVNESTRHAELKARLKEIIRKCDISSFSNPNILESLEHHELIHEGHLVWRITKQKLVDVLLILTDQILLVLTRESNDRFCLKQHTNPSTKRHHKPDIKMDDLLTRDVATDPTAFFLVSKNQDIIYEFAAQTQNERKQWNTVITKTINDYKESHLFVSSQVQKSGSIGTIGDLSRNDSNKSHEEVSGPHSVPPPPPPPNPAIFSRPLPKPPVESPSSSIPPPPPPPPPPPLKNKYAGVIQYASVQDAHPSSVNFVPFDQIKVNNEPTIHFATTQASAADIKEIKDNICNLFNERHKSSRILSDEMEREIQDLSMVYDIAQHDELSSREMMCKLSTDLFKKAMFVFDKLVDANIHAKQDLYKVINPFEQFIKTHIDYNYDGISTIEPVVDLLNLSTDQSNHEAQNQNVQNDQQELCNKNEEDFDYIQNFAHMQINEFINDSQTVDNGEVLQEHTPPSPSSTAPSPQQQQTAHSNSPNRQHSDTIDSQTEQTSQKFDTVSTVTDTGDDFNVNVSATSESKSEMYTI